MTEQKRRNWLRVAGIAPLLLAVLGFQCVSKPRDHSIATEVERIRGGESHGLLNIVILGDGFTAATMAGYEAAADSLASRLLTVAPFQAMADAISIHRVNVVSAEDGITVPESCGTYVYEHPELLHSSLAPWARKKKSPNTALKTTWCDSETQTYRYIDTTDWPALLEAANSTMVFPHIIIVLVNDWFYGATAWPKNPLGIGNGGVAFVSIGQNLTGETHPVTGALIVTNATTPFQDVAAHEIGHLGPFLLWDEYGGSSALPNELATDIDLSPNLTRSTATPLKWESLRTPLSTSLPTDCTVGRPPDVAAVEGGNGYSTGVFHPRCACRMNDSSSATYCPVCRQQIIQQLTNFAPAADTVRIMLDSLRLTTGPAGQYFIDYTVTAGAQSFTDRWPKAPNNFPLDPAATAEVGERWIDVKLINPIPGTIQLDYRLSRQTTSAAVNVESASVVLHVPPFAQGGLVQIEKATHRLIVGLARR